MSFLDKNQQIKGYVVESMIKSCGFYETYKVIDENNTPYFLKIYDLTITPKELLFEDKGVLEFLNCMDLSNRHILEFIDCGKFSAVDKNYSYMITKYYVGELLEDYVCRKGRLSAAESIAIMKKLLEGVSYMHRNGIIHNRLASSNIIIDAQNNPIIIDLGNSCREGDKECIYNIDEKDMLFLANDALKGQHSKRTDTFSLVVLFYMMVAGRIPWDNLDSINKESITEIRKLPLDFSKDGIDDNLQKIFKKGLLSDCSNNYQNIEELIYDLRQINEIDPLISTRKLRVEAAEDKQAENKKKNLIETPKLKGNGFADIAGMSELKDSLKKKVLFWLKNKEQAHKYKITLPNGMLLYGPPGCGKTFFAEKFAEEAGFNFMMVKASDIASTYIHGTQEKIASLFDRAQKMNPSILCFDEFDAVVPERTDMMQQTSGEVNEFLSQMNNCGHRGIFVIATSNRPDKIDPAILRTGRIDKLIYIPMPDEEARLEIFKMHLKDRPTLELNLRKLAKETEGYIASDIAYIVNDAAMNAGIQNLPISDSMLEASLKQTSPSVRPDVVKQYERVRDVLQGTGINRRIPRIGFTSELYTTK